MKQVKPPCKLSLLTPARSGPLFLLQVIDYVLGTPLGNPGLTVNLKIKEVTVYGKTYPLDLPYILIVDSLVRANGNLTSFSQMQKDHGELLEYERIDRPLNKLVRDYPDIGRLIQRVPKKGYFIPKKFLT